MKNTEHTKKSEELPEFQGGAAVVSALPPQQEKKRTLGNIIYDFGVFGSVAWLGVYCVSAFFGHESMYGKNKYFNWLRTLNDKISGGVSNFLSKNSKNLSPEDIEGYARGSAMFATLGTGGSMLMPLIKWMEDNRQKNAAKIDKFLGTTPPEQEAINEPKQTWKSVFSGRLLSWGGSYLCFLGLGAKNTKIANDAVGKFATEQWMKFKPASNPASVRKWADIVGFDTIFTAITASVTYIFSRYVAKRDNKQIDAEDELFEINKVDPHIITREIDNIDSHGKAKFADKITDKNRQLPETPVPLLERATTSGSATTYSLG